MKALMQRAITISSSLATMAMVSGCELAYQNEAKKFAEEQVRSCNGEVSEVAVVRSPEASNYYDGLAEIKIGDEKYSMNMKIKTGSGGSIIDTNDDICTLHKLKRGFKEIFGDSGNL